MPITNAKIVAIFNEMADFLKGEISTKCNQS